MKRSSFFAALLALSPAVIAAPSFAQDASSGLTPINSGTDVNQSGTTTRMFIINAANAGALTFSGVGTANFNNSIGENNQFVVGSSTNLGVSAQLSSTPEFDAVAKANLALTGDSSLMQTNGTASQAANAQAASSAAASSALQTSLEMTDQKFGSTLDEFKTANAGSTSTGSWWGEYFGGTTSVSTITAAQYEEAKEAFKTEKYSEAYSSAINSASSSSSGNNQNGVISGNFVSSSNSASQLAQTVNQEQVFTAAAASAAAAADERFGGTYQTIEQGSWAAGQSWASQEAWSNAKAEYQTTLTKTFSDSGQQSAQAGLTSNDTSNVTVTGLGAIATVNSKDTSAFLVDLSRLTDIAQTNSTATASGSANSSLSTNSFASQSRAETASAFMQAFSAASALE